MSYLHMSYLHMSYLHMSYLHMSYLHSNTQTHTVKGIKPGDIVKEISKKAASTTFAVILLSLKFKPLQPRSVGGAHGGRAPPAKVPSSYTLYRGHRIKKYGAPWKSASPPTK